MAKKPLKACNHPMCPNLTSGAKCEEHTKQTRRRYDESRGTASERGYDHQWHSDRDAKLRRDPLCERCLKRGITRKADLVHHKDRNPRNRDPENHESLCKDCHDLEHKDDRFGGK